jgi:hypothetical protein
MPNENLYKALRALRDVNLPDDFYATSVYDTHTSTPLSKIVTPDDLPEVRDHDFPPWEWQVFAGWRNKRGEKVQHFWVETENRLLYLKHAKTVAQTLAPWGYVSFGSSWRWERTEEIPNKFIPIYTVFCSIGNPGKVPPLYMVCESPDPRADWSVNDWCKSVGHALEGSYSCRGTKTGFVFCGSPDQRALIKKAYADCTFTLEGKGKDRGLRVDYP